MAIPFLGPLFSLIGTIASGLFGSANRKAEVVETAFGVLNNVNSTESAKASAAGLIISTEAKSGFWLTAMWRPLIMVVFAGIIVASFFGFTPVGLDAPMGEMMTRLFDLMELGIGGYIGGRTLEKIVQQLSLGSVLKKMMDKYI